MKGDLRKQALANWQKLFSMPANLISDEARYDKLLRGGGRHGALRAYQKRRVAQAGRSRKQGHCLRAPQSAWAALNRNKKARTGRAL
jgi:hypothetical protein